jgi:hypothetical protein
VTQLVLRAATPILASAAVFQTLSMSLRTAVTEEAPSDNLVVYAALVGLNIVVERARPLLRAAWLRRRQRLATTAHLAWLSVAARSVRDVVLGAIEVDAGSYSHLTKRAGDWLWSRLETRLPLLTDALTAASAVVSHQPLLQFVLSGLAWDVIETKLSHSVSVALPIYSYSVPFVVSLMLVRLRVALSDSYYYLLWL